jgi:uncharacterized membrane protein YeaQ/YmgE (transglycosylase-associated protein family)
MVMQVLGWIIFGLIAGVLAKLLMPGKDPGGFIITILLGIAGSLIGGYAGSLLGLKGSWLLNFVLAVAGAMLLLGLYRVLKRGAAA